MKPLIVIQLEGVLHPCTTDTTAPLRGPATPGAFKFLQSMLGHASVQITSPRLKRKTGAAEIWEWLRTEAFAERMSDLSSRAIISMLATAIGYCHLVPASAVYISANAIPFDGTWPSLKRIELTSIAHAPSTAPPRALWQRLYGLFAHP